MAELTAPTDLFRERRQRVEAIRGLAEPRLADGASGLLVCTTLGDRFCQFVADLCDELLDPQFASRVAVVGVGGTGRGIMCPHSDLDLMLLAKPAALREFEEAAVPMVQAVWDAGIKLGHSIRTPQQAVRLAHEDDKTATSFLTLRAIWGSDEICRSFRKQFRTQVVERSRTRFTRRCVRARKSEFSEKHPASQMLEPNVKTSLGALRDLDLVSWVAEAHYDTSNFTTLQLDEGRLSQVDAMRLTAATDFLLRLRCRLHLWAGGAEDRLTRAAQLAIADSEHVEATDTQRSVERLMQEYFQHTTAVAAIAERFVNRHQPRPVWRAVWERVRERRIDRKLIAGPLRVDASLQDQASVTADLASILRIYEVGASRNVRPSPTLSDAIRVAATRIANESELDPETLTLGPIVRERFRAILDSGRATSQTLRHMAQTGTLDLVLPEWRHLRGLLQFNQYHHFTVDEHTLRAVQICTLFERQDSPVGRAYRGLKNKAVVHLAVVLHDIGKGFEEDHCIVGERIAALVGPRLGFNAYECGQLTSLVRLHLDLSDLALRRDITDEMLIADFARQVGTADTLAMLYVLTVADIKAVGPGTWTKWKGELLADLFQRVSVVLSGKPYHGFEADLIEQTIRETTAIAVPISGSMSKEGWADYVRRQLAVFPTYYLTTTSPEQIASDLATLRELTPGTIDIHCSVDPASGTYSFRVLLHEATAQKCFHQICGVLAARGFRIFSAQISTTTDGYVIDGFQARQGAMVNDPNLLMQSTADDIRGVLLDGEEVTAIYHRHERYGVDTEDEALPSGLTSRVELDTHASKTRLVIDVFTHSRRGLLYTLAKTLLDLNLNLELAKIGTHFDQVIDVFYVVEADGSKPAGHDRLSEIRKTIEGSLDEFQNGGFLAFRRSGTK